MIPFLKRSLKIQHGVCCGGFLFYICDTRLTFQMKDYYQKLIFKPHLKLFIPPASYLTSGVPIHETFPPGIFTVMDHDRATFRKSPFFGFFFFLIFETYLHVPAKLRAPHFLPLSAWRATSGEIPQVRWASKIRFRGQEIGPFGWLSEHRSFSRASLNCHGGLLVSS